MEHKICKGCRWNKYPKCEGIIMMDGNFMDNNIMKPDFRCGQKDSNIVNDLTPKKSDLKLKIEQLETRILELEERLIKLEGK